MDLNIKERQTDKNEMNILVLGETGVGKSTWINGFNNYLTFDSLEEAERGETVGVISSKFTMEDSNYNDHTIIYNANDDKNEFIEKNAESATKMPKSYVFNLQNIKIRIIDTPGMGDTRGIEQDKENMQNILDHLSQYKELNGIIVMLNTNTSRLHVMFEFCIKQLIVNLHKDACKNMLFCFTQCKGTNYRPGETKSVLKELLSRNKITDIKVNGDTIFCMDNESVRYLMARNTIRFDDREREEYVTTWNKAVEVTKNMISYISSLEPHAIQDTISINEIRRCIIEQSRPIAHITEAIYINIIEIEEKEVIEINETKNIEELYKQLQIPITCLKAVPLACPRTVCTALKCVEIITVDDGTCHVCYKTICHAKCQITAAANIIGSAGIKDCAKMKRGLLRFKGKRCEKCQCKWYMHMHITYDVMQENVMMEDPKIRKMITEKDGVNKAIEEHKKQLECKRNQLKHEEKQLTKINAHFACFLKHYSIIPYNDALMKYLDTLIENEEMNVGNGNENSSKKLERLKNLKQVYEKEIEEIEERLKNGDSIKCLDTENIKKLMQTLKELPIVGSMLADIMAKVQEANDASRRLNESVVEVKPTKMAKVIVGILKYALSSKKLKYGTI